MPARRVLRGRKPIWLKGDIKSLIDASIVAVCNHTLLVCHVDFSVIVASERDRSDINPRSPLIPTYLTWVKLAAQPLKVDPHSLCDY